jgi:hypothetical protein
MHAKYQIDFTIATQSMTRVGSMIHPEHVGWKVLERQPHHSQVTTLIDPSQCTQLYKTKRYLISLYNACTL